MSNKDFFVTDHADYNSPVSKLFNQPSTPDEWREYMLSEDQVRFFEENGFLSGIKIMDEDQVDLFTKELSEIVENSSRYQHLFYYFKKNESSDPGKVLFHAIGAWRIQPGFHDLLWSPAFRMATYQLMGQNFRLFHDQLFLKPPLHGGVVAWHQDFSYWTFTKPMNHLTCWVGLDDTTVENGCLYYIPGSHKWGLLPITGLAGDMDAVQKVLSKEQLEQFEKKVANELPKGYCSFHHPLTMHGSFANLSDRPRRAVVLNAMGHETQSNFDDYYRKDDLKYFPTLGKTGDQLNSKFFPLLFDGDKELEAIGRDILLVGIY